MDQEQEYVKFFGERMEKTKVRKIKIIGAVSAVIAVFLFVWIFLVRSVTPNAGFEAVLIHKPIIFGHGGVDPATVKTGRKYIWFSTKHVLVYTQPRQFEVHFEDLMSSDGVPLDFDAVLRLRVIDAYRLISVFGEYWYENNVYSEFRNRVRQSVRKHGMNETAIDTKAIDAIDAEVSEAMRQYIASVKLPVEFVDVTVGKANPPDSIKDQRVATAAQQQRILTENERKKAEDARENAERSRAKADNVYRVDMQLSPDQFLRLETIKMQREVCAEGKCTFIFGGGVTPTLDVKK